MGTIIGSNISLFFNVSGAARYDGPAINGAEIYNSYYSWDVSDYALTFNGYSSARFIENLSINFRDAGNLPAITSVQVVAGTAPAFTWNADGVTMDISNMSFTGGTSFKLDFGFSATDIELKVGLLYENDKGAAVGTLENNDFDGTTTTYTVDNDRFEVVNGVLKLKDGQALDYETAENGQVVLTVTATDTAGAKDSYTESFAINIIDRNEAPTDVEVNGGAKLVIAENVPAGTIVGQISHTDPDDGDKIIYTVDDSRFTIDVNGNLVASGLPIDFETDKTITVSVTATDSAKQRWTEKFVVNVSDQNEAPTDVEINDGQKLVIVENASAGTVVGKISHTDPDADRTVTYTVDDSRFKVDASGNLVASGNLIDFETDKTIAVYVTATDGGNLSRTEKFIVNVDDQNEAPTGIKFPKVGIAENAPAGTIVAKISHTDPDVGDKVTYTVDDDRFEVDSNGNLVTSGLPIDYESGSAIIFNIKATDEGGLSKTEEFRIIVSDENEAPTSITLDTKSPTVSENSGAGVVVAAISHVDPDFDKTVTYAVDDKRFMIDSNGNLVTSGQPIDYETDKSITVSIQATDALGLSTTETFVINVTDVNENTGGGSTNRAPIVTSANVDTTVQSGQLISLTVGDGHFSDPDGTDLDYTITVNGAAKPAWLTFDGETGLLGGTPTSAEAGAYTVNVTATDGSLSIADEFVLIITNPVAPSDPKGTRRNDKLVGDAGDNILDGKRGNDRLTGGDGADTFVLGKHYGHDKVLDFDAAEGDMIDLSDAIGIRSFKDLMAHHVNDTDAGLMIRANDGSTLFLNGTDADDLTGDMFIF